MRPRGLAHEQVERPSAGDPPWDGDALEDGGSFSYRQRRPVVRIEVHGQALCDSSSLTSARMGPVERVTVQPCARSGPQGQQGLPATTINGPEK